MNPQIENLQLQTRRALLGNAMRPVGAAALASLIGADSIGAPANTADRSQRMMPGLPELPHFPAKAKRVIYLFMCGGPSHIDTFDYHPEIRDYHGQELPDSVRQGQRITTMTSGQKSFPVVAPMFKFKKHGEHGNVG